MPCWTERAVQDVDAMVTGACEKVTVPATAKAPHAGLKGLELAHHFVAGAGRDTAPSLNGDFVIDSAHRAVQ